VTAVAGSSEVYRGGVIAYVNGVKQALLGVDPGTLRRYSAVSAETAMAMARGARARLRTDWAVSVTGIAGPGGGTPEQPVGLVYIGLASPAGEVTATRFQFPGARDAVRDSATEAALGLLAEALGAPPRPALDRPSP
jgi:nicotinamide-nucleotide amidase